MILSADATLAAKRESIEAGADEFLTKPIIAATLLAAIERLVAGVDERSAEPKLPPQTTAASGSSSPGPLVDPDRLQALRRIARGDVKFLEQYTNAAFAELEQAISELRIASAAGNSSMARDALHIIEGTGGSIGAVALVANCKAVRNYFAVPDDPECAGALAELSTTYALTKSTIIATLRHSRDKAVDDRGARK